MESFLFNVVYRSNYSSCNFTEVIHLPLCTVKLCLDSLHLPVTLWALGITVTEISLAEERSWVWNR
jgi:hypothetical protein